MFDPVSMDDVRALAHMRHSICVSVYLPLYPESDESSQDAVRLRKAIDLIVAALRKEGLSLADARHIVNRAAELADDADFWSTRSHTLAFFTADGTFRRFRLGRRVDEMITVSRIMNLAPLLPEAESGGGFLLLALSEHHIRLFRVHRHSLQEIKVANLSGDLREALNVVSLGRGEQVHSGRPSAKRKEAAVFHGQGGEPDAARDELVDFCEFVDRELRPALVGADQPLLLAGVKRLTAVFREHCSYQHVVEEPLTGNFDRASDYQLLELSNEAMAPFFQRRTEKRLERLSEAVGRGRAEFDPYRIADAAEAGRIEALFVDPDSRLARAALESANLAAGLDTSSATRPRDLVNISIAETLLHDGAVFSVTSEEMPDETPLGAILRY